MYQDLKAKQLFPSQLFPFVISLRISRVDGHAVTTHWSALDELARPVDERAGCWRTARWTPAGMAWAANDVALVNWSVQCGSWFW
jgi:hypothetical protein